MAKKKPDGKVTILSPGQYKKLGMTLGNTSWNVYTLARTMFAADVGEEVFDGLRRHAGVCRCGACSLWKDSSEMSDIKDTCEECANDEGREV